MDRVDSLELRRLYGKDQVEEVFIVSLIGSVSLSVLEMLLNTN